MLTEKIHTDGGNTSNRAKVHHPYQAELRRLSGFIRDKACVNGLSLHAFCKKHGLNSMTINNYVNGRQFPELKILTSLAKALRDESGELISARTLFDLIDPVEGAIDGSGTGEEYRTLGKAEHLLEEFESLPFDVRLSIASSLQRQIARDIQLAVAKPAELLAILLDEELNRRGIGLGRFAEKIGVDEAILEAIAKKVTANTIDLKNISRIADNVKDTNGEYGNLNLFIKLVGSNVRINSLVQRLMEERSIETVPELVDYLLETSETKATARQKKEMAQSIELMLETGKLTSQNNKNYTKIVPALAKELGFERVMDLVEFLKAHNSCTC